jgi:hypothetical protein
MLNDKTGEKWWSACVRVRWCVCGGACAMVRVRVWWCVCVLPSEMLIPSDARQSLESNMGSGQGYTQICSSAVNDTEGSATLPCGLNLSGCGQSA